MFCGLGSIAMDSDHFFSCFIAFCYVFMFVVTEVTVGNVLIIKSRAKTKVFAVTFVQILVVYSCPSGQQLHFFV